MNLNLRRIWVKWWWAVLLLGTLTIVLLLSSTRNNMAGSFSSVYGGFMRMEVDEEEPGSCNVFREKIVHFDLKGAPPKVAFYRQLFPFLQRLNVSAVLMEYEDMFPYTNELAVLARSNAYSVEEIHEICMIARKHNLNVIPLVQTFGHLEYALKHERFSHLREVSTKADTICPSDSRSLDLVHEMLKQVYRVHSDVLNLTTIHIGADEAWSIAQDERCLQRLTTQLENDKDRLKLDHISSVARFAKDQLGIQRVLVWNDMFDKINSSLMNEYELGQLVVPVVWGYIQDVTRPDYFPGGMFERYSHTFGNFLFGGAFKGANGIDQNFISAERYLDNLYSYVRLCNNNKTEIESRVSGVILTGWSRYKHDLPLCELLPAGIPTLVAELLYLAGQDGSVGQKQILERTLRYLDCQQRTLPNPSQHFTHIYEPPIDSLFATCNFPGKEIFAEIEKLRFVAWKVRNFNHEELASVKKQIFNELDEIERNIKPLLSQIFYKDDVNEWIADNLQKYRVFEDVRAIHHT